MIIVYWFFPMLLSIIGALAYKSVSEFPDYFAILTTLMLTIVAILFTLPERLSEFTTAHKNSIICFIGLFANLIMGVTLELYDIKDIRKNQSGLVIIIKTSFFVAGQMASIWYGWKANGQVQ